MSKLDCHIVWDGKALSNYIRNAPEITNALYDKASEKADEINASIYGEMGAGYDKGDAVRVSMRQIKYTQAAVIVPTKTGVARFMRKHQQEW